ncbi:MAG: glutamate--tRNA ligase family protein [Bacteroidota bacterium]
MAYTRIAPTPSGYLHLGNAYNFLLTSRLSTRHGGQLLLRIDDIDRARYREAYVQDVFDSLDWLGIDYQVGPNTIQEFESKWSQQLRIDRYQEILDELRAKNLVYPCAYSRREIQAMTTDGIYRGENRNSQLSLDQAGVAWRVKVPKETSLELTKKDSHIDVDIHREMGDFVVRKKDGLPAYQIASLVDDVDHGIQLIVRGEDLIPSTAAQLHLAECLDFLDFRRSVTFHHHPLILDAAGQKLAKSQGAQSLKAMRESGFPPPEFAF